MSADTETVRNFRWQDLGHESAFRAWKWAKIRVVESLATLPPVQIDSLSDPSGAVLDEIARRCALGNYALYTAARGAPDVAEASAALAGFAARMGLTGSEDHRSAGAAGVVALRTSADEARKGYIPYTPKAMNWHTDGYYNPPDRPVTGFILHCLSQAAQGGENRLMDPEIAYLRLRDENPGFVRALMHPQAMAIPENREPDGTLRPESIGPVFFADPATARLQMRYTARTRSIRWRDDPLTLEAADWLRAWLTAGDPLMRHVRLEPGQGIVNNNVLHNRTRFEDGAAEDATRIILRVRFHARVAERLHGAT